MRLAMHRALRAAATSVALTASVVPWATATTIPPGTQDLTGQPAATILFADFAYSPPALAVGRSGASDAEVTWSGSFASHPLRFESLSVAGNSSGTTAARQLRSGRYAYYCNFHGTSLGMKGEVYVVGPRAALVATPADVAPGATATLDASATDLVSFAAASATYAFDPEGDGSFQPAGSATSIQATYATEGTFAARVRVTDNAGRVDEATFDVDVARPGATPQPPPTPPNPGGPSGSTPGAAATFGEVAGLPSARRCVNRRRGLRIVLRDSGDADVRSARILVNGRVVRRVSGIGTQAAVNVRRLPRGRPRVKVVVTLADGTVLSRTVRYRACGG